MSSIYVLVGTVEERLANIPEGTFQALLSDPPYGLSFLGKDWDKALPTTKALSECLRVLCPGALCLFFSGTRTFHRMAVKLEDVGFEIIDCLIWLHTNGLPKGQDIGKQIDRKNGNERTEVLGHYKMPDGNPRRFVKHVGGPGYEGGFPITAREKFAPVSPEAKIWEGYKTQIKPSWEPVLLCRKPSTLSLRDCALTYGTGAFNVPETRLDNEGGEPRFPSNVITEEGIFGEELSRYFYCPKVRWGREKKGNPHPTIKPVSLTERLALLLRPPLDVSSKLLVPYAGSGSEVIGAHFARWHSITAVEKSHEYLELFRQRVSFARTFKLEQDWRAAL